VRGGGRWTASGFVLEGKARPMTSTAAARIDAAGSGPRFGFTVTKKLGSAVVRNRIRRRLRAALAEVVKDCADPYFDYVVIARDAALNQPFELLKSDLETALQRVHKPSQTKSSRERPGP